MRWFRFYSEVLNSKKAQDLSPALFKFWINLLALANEQEPRGELPSDEEIAFRLRLPAKKTEVWMNELTGRGLVDDNTDTITMHNWDKWQFGSDTRATDGRRKYDEARRKRGAKWESAPRDNGASGAADTETEQTQKTEAESDV